MFKKIVSIVLLLFLTISSPVSAGGERQGLAPNTVISKISSLWNKENQLRQTWSYTGLASLEMAAPMLEYSTLGIWGVLGKIGVSVTQYNAAPLLKKLSHFLPLSYRSSYKSVVDGILLTFHTSAVIQNPLRHGSGYLFGLVGVYITSQFLDKCPAGLKEEVEGFAYFCFKKAGFHIHDQWENEIYGFLESIPQALRYYIFPMSSCTPLDEQQCQPFVNPLTIPPLDKDELKKLEAIRQSKLTVHPSLVFENVCNRLSKGEQEKILADFYNRTAPLLMSFMQQARNNGQKVGIILGENHYTCSCLLIEIELFKLFSHQGGGNRTLFFETSTQSIQNLHNALQRQDFDKYGNISLDVDNWASKYAYAIKAGFDPKSGEPDYRRIFGDPLSRFLKALDPMIYEEIRIKLAENELRASHQKQELEDIDINVRTDLHGLSEQQRLERDLEMVVLMKQDDPARAEEVLSIWKKDFEKHHAEIKDCIDFRTRDKSMVRTLEAHDGDFTYITGAYHLGNLNKLLNVTKNRVYLSLTCFSDTYKGFDHTLDTYNLIRRYTSDQCAREYTDYIKDMDNFKGRSNPCLVATIDDEELTHK